jgi:hypothetical protein
MNKNERLLLLESVFYSMLEKENSEDLQGLQAMQEMNEIEKSINIRFLTETEYLMD